MRQKNLKYFIRKYSRFVKYLLLICLVVSLPIFILFFLQKSDYFKITTFTYTGVVKYVNKGDFENLVTENISHKNYFSLITAQFEQLLKDNFLSIKSVKVTKTFFSKINVNVQERTPVAVIIDSQNERFLLDSDGYVLGVVDASYVDLPIINYAEKLYVGTFVSKNIIPIAMELLTSSKVESVDVSSISFKPEHAEFFVGQTFVYMGYIKNIPESLKIISRLLQESLASSAKITKIDLRYEKVIVSYE